MKTKNMKESTAARSAVPNLVGTSRCDVPARVQRAEPFARHARTPSNVAPLNTARRAQHAVPTTSACASGWGLFTNRRGLMILILVCLGCAGPARAGTNEVSALLQKGLFEEEANRNLDAAILAYQAVIDRTDKDRQFVATAIFRLGECYRKQGKTNEAGAQYQRVLREFADQKELAKLSRDYAGGVAVAGTAEANDSPGLQNQWVALQNRLVAAKAERNVVDLKYRNYKSCPAIDYAWRCSRNIRIPF